MNKVQIILIAILVFFLLSYKLTQPFWGHHEFNGVFHGMLAKNHLRYGLIKSRGARIDNLYPVSPNNWSFHPHRPATYTVFLSILYRIFGSQEAVARLPSIAASILGVVLLAKLLEAVYEKTPYIWLAVLPLMFTALFRYYGSMPVFEPLLLPIFAYGLYNYWKNRNKKRSKGYIYASIAAMFIDWSGLWLPIWLTIFEILTRRRRRVISELAATILLVFLLLLALHYIAYGTFSNLSNIAKYRLAFTQQPYTPIGWIRLLGARTRAFWGDSILIASIIGFVIALLKRGSLLSRFLLINLGIGVTHIVVFRNFTWYHDYMIYHIIPFISLSLGSFIEVIHRKTKSEVLIIITVLVLSIATFLDTRRFFIDLNRMQGHKDCIEMGRQVRKSQDKLTFYLNKEKAKECPTFIGFYGEKDFEIIIVD
jgi:hypothetical protein